jgi:type IV pilus assembly protein PilN
MIRINLLPTEEVERAADQRQQIATVGLVVALSVLVFIVLHSVQAARMARANHRLSQVREELEAITGPYQELVKIQAQQKELEAKLKVITQLEARSGGPVKVMSDLSGAMPDKLWLTEFNEAAGTVKMSGYSVDEQTIADFLRRLGSSSYFTGVDLEETTQVTQENVKQKKFTLKAQVNYAGGPAATPPAGAPAAPGAQPPGKTAAATPASPTMTASAAGVTP